MELYANNNKLRKYKVIETIDGTKEYLRNCIKMNDEYYRIESNPQAINISGRWYKITDPNVEFDSEKQQYFLLSNATYGSICKGIVGISDGKFIEGCYSKNITRNCKIYYMENDKPIHKNCISYEIPKSLGYIEHINEEIWAEEKYFGNAISKSDLGLLNSSVATRVAKIYNRDKKSFTTPQIYKYENKAYNAEDCNEFEDAVKVYGEYKVDLSKDVKKAARLIGDLTYGCEIEVKGGTLPKYLLGQLGLVICRDGSIGYTPEFVTVPLKGAKGLQTLQNLFIELNKRCNTDHTCSLHFHIGSIRKDREFIVALYKLYTNIQGSLHDMLPYYKTDPSGVKEKNYCQFLGSDLVKFATKNTYRENVNYVYNSIQTWVLDGTPPGKKFNRKSMIHPHGDRKWSWNSRYHSLNLLNMFISDRQTIEFRGHQSILSDIKAINWLFVCIAVIRYTENNSSRILTSKKKITLEEVLNYYGDTFKTPYSCRVSKYLIDYHKDRKKFFSTCRHNGDYIVKSDYQETDFKFSNGELNAIF